MINFKELSKQSGVKEQTLRYRHRNGKRGEELTKTVDLRLKKEVSETKPKPLKLWVAHPRLIEV